VSSRADSLYNNAFSLINNVGVPNVEDMELQLQDLVLQGILSPEDAQAALAGDSAMGGITLDPALKQKQMASLAALQDLADNGGVTLTDQANLRKTMDQVNAEERGARDAIISNADARGMGGSGLALMSQMKNQQDAATRASNAGLDMTAKARDMALQALIQGGTQAGNVRSQDFNEQSQIAQGQDAISKFNAANQQQTNLANTAARNNAQQMNLQAKQAIANTNTAQRNSSQQYNKELQQKNYENQMNKAQTGANLLTGHAASSQAQSNADRENNQKLIGTALTAAAMFSDENVKEDVECFDPSAFLDSIVPKKYRYKDESMGEGERYGIMAQDLEKSPAGDSIVKDTPVGKAVDTAQATGPILASLGDLHHRLKRIEGDGHA